MRCGSNLLPPTHPPVQPAAADLPLEDFGARQRRNRLASQRAGIIPVLALPRRMGPRVRIRFPPAESQRVAGPMWRPRNAGVRGGTMSSNLLCSSGESGTNRRGRRPGTCATGALWGTETLDYVPGRFKVVRHIREKLSCRACDTVVAAPAADHAIARGRAGAGLLAHIVVSKYDDHLPLYRQAEIFARDGVSLPPFTGCPRSGSFRSPPLPCPCLPGDTGRGRVWRLAELPRSARAELNFFINGGVSRRAAVSGCARSRQLSPCWRTAQIDPLRVLAGGSLGLPGSGHSHNATQQFTPTGRAAPSPFSNRRCRTLQ